VDFKNKKVRVIKKHNASYDKAIDVKTGDSLKIDYEKSKTYEPPGWLWCIDQSGLGSWVPKVFIDVMDDRATLVRDYNAIELNVNENDELTVLNEAAGWYWCRTEDNKFGWVPVENVVFVK
jgi:hypothetical protein